MSPSALTERHVPLAHWIAALGAEAAPTLDRQRHVRGLADDSRLVQPGDLFFARRGPLADGARYARDAVLRGASAVVSDAPLPTDVPWLRVADVEAALERAADDFYGRPQDALDLVAVTGTKGKTTTSWLVAAALRHAERRTAVLGTIQHELGDGPPQPAGNTTPGVLEIRRLLARARDAGCQAAVMEVSSHALDQRRTRGLEFRAGVFTNLGHDHLDYHGSQEAYFEAKSLLFSGLASSATAVLNAEDPMWPRLAALCRGRVVTYGLGRACDLYATGIVLSADGTRFRLLENGHLDIEVETPLVGRHNVLNLCAAVGAATALDVDPVRAAVGASGLPGVRGRLERVVPSEDLHVFVDYAHTEESLRSVLGFLDEIRARPLTVVIGCGGDRDRTKRPRMARAAAELADRAVLTSDNPRTEDPEAILRDMNQGLDGALAARAVTIPDRRAAIRRAVLEAPPGACVLVAGKGHEDYQVIGREKIHFDDIEEVREALRLRSRAGPGGSAPGAPDPV